MPLFENIERIGLIPRRWTEDYPNIAPRYLDITSKIYCSVEGSNRGIERVGRERIAFMIRTDAPVRTDKFSYDEDEHLSIHEFESRHISGDWSLASTKLESAWIYALLVTSDELDRLLHQPRTRRYLGALERRHISCPSTDRPPVLPARFARQFPDEDVVVGLSQFVVIRDTLTVNYVNGRFVRRPPEEMTLLEKLAKQPMTVTVSMKATRRKLEKLLRFGIITIQ
jgi:hypothetical protein